MPVLHAFQFLLEVQQLLFHLGTQKGTSQPNGLCLAFGRLRQKKAWEFEALQMNTKSI